MVVNCNLRVGWYEAEITFRSLSPQEMPVKPTSSEVNRHPRQALSFEYVCSAEKLQKPFWMGIRFVAMLSVQRGLRV